ncbi:MAG: polyprenol monophosphomannose synthase [bacterium]|nr:polyprenol monophosphomannose synthase [bacterium]
MNHQDEKKENYKKNLVIIPTYNEKENIVPLMEKILETVSDTHIVVVDDNSPDHTAREVREYAKEHRRQIHLIVREDERGLGGAYRTGLQYGLEQGYGVLITMDADHSHNPVHLPPMLEAIKNNDVVIGSRYIRDGGTINWRIRRILLSWLANRFARFMLRLTGSDLTSGYRAYRREILENIGLEQVKSNGYSYLVEMIFRVQQRTRRVGEVPIIFYDRTMGKSKISKKEVYRGVFTLLRLRLTGGGKPKEKEPV